MFATTINLKDGERSGRLTSAVLTEEGLYWPLVDYFRRRNLELGSERSYARSICLLMNWSRAKHPEFQATPDGDQALFSSFLHELVAGTIKDGNDPSGLWWSPCSAGVVRKTAAQLAEFTSWVASRQGGIEVNARSRCASFNERLVSMRAFAHRKDASMFAHTKSRVAASENARLTRAFKAPGRSEPDDTPIAAFPANRISDLLWVGFERAEFKDDPRPWVRWNIRDMLITLLCLFGGLRRSEPMHLWVGDVFAEPSDPASCRVLIHHPENGIVDCRDALSGRAIEMPRLQYLNERCGGKRPLTMETGRRKSGWKNVALTDPARKAFQVFWINADAGRLFAELWLLYVAKARAPHPNTPWAFLTQDGQPMGPSAYKDSFAKAVAKIGMTPRKWSAGTPHSLRHRYGQILNELDISEKIGQICMHHRSPQSQAVYRKPILEDVASALEKARQLAQTSATQLWRQSP